MYTLVLLITTVIFSCDFILSAPSEPASIDELSEELGKHEETLKVAVESAKKVQNLRKLLARKFMEQRLYGRASELLDLALKDEPTNAELNYLSALSSAYIAKSQPDEIVRQQHLEKAEFYYYYAVELEPRHAGYLYALSVFLLYERSGAKESLPFIKILREINSKDVTYTFLEGHAHASVGERDKAVAAYRDIEQNSRATKTQKELASSLIKEMQGGL